MDFLANSIYGYKLILKSIVIQASGRNDQKCMVYILKYFIFLGLKVTGRFTFIYV